MIGLKLGSSNGTIAMHDMCCANGIRLVIAEPRSEELINTKSRACPSIKSFLEAHGILGDPNERKALSLKTASSFIVINNTGYCQAAVDQDKNANTQTKPTTLHHRARWVPRRMRQWISSTPSSSMIPRTRVVKKCSAPD